MKLDLRLWPTALAVLLTVTGSALAAPNPNDLSVAARAAQVAASETGIHELTVDEMSTLRELRPGNALADSADPFVPFYRIVLHPEHPTTSTPVTLTLAGPSPYGAQCAAVVNPRVLGPERIAFTLRPSLVGCPAPATWRQEFQLGQFAVGPHQVVIEATLVRAEADSAGDTTATVHRRIFEFLVGPDSIVPPPPPPPPNGIPYVGSVRISPLSNSYPVTRPICQGDSILVQFAGFFPNNCYELRGIQLIPDLSMGPIPLPPFVRLLVDSTGCYRRLCLPHPTPWQGAIAIAPLQVAIDYQLRVEMTVGACGDSLAGIMPRYAAAYAFTVNQCGPDTLPCLVGRFLHASGSCDATVSPGRPGRIAFGLKSFVDLSGLQGEFQFDQPGLRIARIAPVGAAAGMRLTWSRTDDGAKFVMFAPSGAPIPASSPVSEEIPPPVLEIQVEQASNARIAPITHLIPVALLGSDVNGVAVPTCAFPNVRFPIDYFAARICRESDCDWNADGVLDVRDLVLMVHCLNERCAVGDGDCNGDSLFTLDDVLCCARNLLGLPHCADCGPDSTPSRHELVSLSMGGVLESAGEVRVPIRLTWTERLGATRIALDYPSDHYDVVDASLSEVSSQWLDLHEVRDGKIVIGLIRIGPNISLLANQKLEVLVRLKLKAGQSPGGRVVASESEFSGNDGVKLIVENGPLAIDLLGRASATLSAASPNPFARATRFSLTLDRSAMVDLGIYDVSGRRVASLHHGALSAGTREFVWNGADEGGARAATGVYFYRATVSGSTVTRKLVMLGNP